LLQQLLDGTCQWNFNGSSCAYTTYNCSGTPQEDLAAACAAKTVAKALPDPAVYTTSVCVSGERPISQRCCCML
jgi:hypothetical protein